jgi:GNAT superfamily N-acetyltransferase
MGLEISPATEEEVRSGYVGRQLREFNYRYAGEYPEVQYIRLNAREDGGRVVGGVRALVAMHWLQVEVLWVEEGARHGGIGSRLLAEVERLGRERGATRASLETFEFQAPAFYAKHGYEEASRIEKYVGSYYLAKMTKRL